MGIPSYYKKLCNTVHALRSASGGRVDWFFMDFNCLIYHCFHKESTPVYDGTDIWEIEFIECIITYCRKVIQHVAPTRGVYIAIDGVVPMAKMRQQRLRRFKSVWCKKYESAKNGVTMGGWDTNAITPGTLFMNKLRMRLEKMVSEHASWKFSSSDEPGEGEHKIIAEWRKGKYSGNFGVYGLDADLIILSMLGREQCAFANEIWLFREEINAGKMVYDVSGEEVFEWFSIHALRAWLCTGYTGYTGYTTSAQETQFILNYCFAMTILGNDFLPSSLGYKIRDDGHSQLITIIQQLTSQGIFLVTPDTYEIDEKGIQSLFNLISANESERILSYICKKQAHSRNADAIGLGENNWPLGHIEENSLMYGRQLDKSWRIKYMQFFGLLYNRTTISKICKEYLQGIQWTWSYYTGNDVCYNWFYPFSLPPLWEWIREASMPAPMNIAIQAHDIRPVEQLALVLPLESWSLIPPCPERLFPQIAPQFYPDVFSFDSVGKRFFWECETMIPLPSIMELKMIISSR